MLLLRDWINNCVIEGNENPAGPGLGRSSEAMSFSVRGEGERSSQEHGL